MVNHRSKFGLIAGVLALAAVMAAAVPAMAQQDLTSVTLNCADNEQAFVQGFLADDGSREGGTDFQLSCDLTGDNNTPSDSVNFNDATDITGTEFTYNTNGNQGSSGIEHVALDDSGNWDGSGGDEFFPGSNYGLDVPANPGNRQTNAIGPNDGDGFGDDVVRNAGQDSTHIVFSAAGNVDAPFIKFPDGLSQNPQQQTTAYQVQQGGFGGDASSLGFTSVESIAGDGDSPGNVDLTSSLGPAGINDPNSTQTDTNTLTNLSIQLQHDTDDDCDTTTGLNTTGPSFADTTTPPNERGGGGNSDGHAINSNDPRDTTNGNDRTNWCLAVGFSSLSADQTFVYRVELNANGPGGSDTSTFFIRARTDGSGNLTSFGISDTNPVNSLAVSQIQTRNTMLGGGNSELNVAVQGQGIQSVGLDVYSLSGSTVASETSLGSTLSWRPLAASGAPLANGVYLYRVTVEGYNGEVKRSDIRKFVVLR